MSALGRADDVGRVPHSSASHPSTLTPTQFRARLTGLNPIRATCPHRQFQPSSRVHTKTVLKDRRNAQTTHATFLKTGPPSVDGESSLGEQSAGILRKPEGAGGVSNNGASQVPGKGSLGIRQNEMSPAIRHPDSPRLRASVANDGHSLALRIAFWTNGPLACTEPAAAGERVTRLPAVAGYRISNRQSCRLETRINPCASMATPFLIVTKIGVFRVSFLR